jgi:hypothetical protein
MHLGVYKIPFRGRALIVYLGITRIRVCKGGRKGVGWFQNDLSKRKEKL